MPRLWHLLQLYVHEAREARRTGDCVGLLDLLRDFPAWARSQGRSGVDDAYPWITFEATRELQRRLRTDWQVFEYGTGGSTMFLSSRVAKVVSVENDADWFGVVKDRFDDRPNVEVLLQAGEPAREAADAAFPSRSALFGTLTFRKYICTIDRYPDGAFDLLIVDGRARVSGFFRGHRKVRMGGAILLDDSQRSGYAAAVTAATTAGWPAVGRRGPKPFTPRFARTTIWTKTSELDDRAYQALGAPDHAADRTT